MRCKKGNNMWKLTFFAATLCVACSSPAFEVAASNTDTLPTDDSGSTPMDSSTSVPTQDSNRAQDSDSASTEPDSTSTKTDTGAGDGSLSDSGGTIGSDGGSITDAASPFVFDFPTHAAFAYNATTGKTGDPFDADKVGYCRSKGDYVEQAFDANKLITKVSISVRIDNQLMGCAAGSKQAFEVLVDTVKIGELPWSSLAVPGPETLTGTFSTSLVSLTTSHVLTIRMQNDVCFGGGSWAWRPGGKVVVE